MKKEKTIGDISEEMDILRESDLDYPYSSIAAAKKGKFDVLGETKMKRFKEILFLKFLLYSPLKCMNIMKILEESKEPLKAGEIINELKARKIIIKNINQSDFKEKYLENLAYFGILGSEGKGKKRRYKISSEFDNLKYEIPSILFWLIGDEYCPIDQIWNTAEKYNRKFGKVTYISQEGEKSEDFDIFKVIYSLMSCNASSKKSRIILKKMENDGIFSPEKSKNQIVCDLIQTARDLGFNEIEQGIAKKAPEFLNLIFRDGNNRKLLDTKLVKQVIEDYLREQDIILSKNLSKEISKDILSFLITDAAKKRIIEISREEILKGMKYTFYEKQKLNLENLEMESKEILNSVKHEMENPWIKKPRLLWLVNKISYYFLLKNGLITQKDDALQELLTDLTRELPGDMASEYKKIKKKAIDSIKQEIQEIEIHLDDTDTLINLIKFSRDYNEEIEEELLFENYEILKQLVDIMIRA